MPTNKTEVPEWQERTHLLIKDSAIKKLNSANVAMIGLGGVGAYAAELICRAGVGKMTIVDGDNKRRFADHELNRLGEKSAKALQRVFDVSARLSGISDDSVEDAVGESAAILSDESPSPSA